MEFKSSAPPIPPLPAGLHFTPTIDGGIHRLYARLPHESQRLIDAWVDFATDHMLPLLVGTSSALKTCGELSCKQPL